MKPRGPGGPLRRDFTPAAAPDEERPFDGAAGTRIDPPPDRFEEGSGEMDVAELALAQMELAGLGGHEMPTRHAAEVTAALVASEAAVARRRYAAEPPPAVSDDFAENLPTRVLRPARRTPAGGAAVEVAAAEPPAPPPLPRPPPPPPRPARPPAEPEPPAALDRPAPTDRPAWPALRAPTTPLPAGLLTPLPAAPTRSARMRTAARPRRALPAVLTLAGVAVGALAAWLYLPQLPFRSPPPAPPAAAVASPAPLPPSAEVQGPPAAAAAARPREEVRATEPPRVEAGPAAAQPPPTAPAQDPSQQRPATAPAPAAVTGEGERAAPAEPSAAPRDSNRRKRTRPARRSPREPVKRPDLVSPF